jgi:3-hydroxy-9,10-secoandrosta-1,3,5(10)-triene-9,17-dione monooxygenase
MKDNAVALIERAQTLARTVEARAQEIDALDRLPDWLIADLRASGLIETVVPECYGGHEMGLDTLAEIVLLFGAACPSVAWAVAFYIGHNWIHCLAPEQAQREIYADRSYVLTAGTLAPLYKLRPVEGGYIANGRTPWASGLPHAEWVMNAGMIEGRDAQGPMTFFVPTDEARPIDNWSVAAMRATGSHDVALEDVFVPAHRVFSTAELMQGGTPGSKLHRNPLYALPVMPVTLCYVLPVLVGALRGAADAFVALTRMRTLKVINVFPSAKKSTASEAQQSAQMRVGRGQAAASLAEGMLREFVAEVMKPDTAFDTERRVSLTARAALIAEFCRDTVNSLMAGAGASAYRDSSPMQRYFRDINMLCNHAALDAEPATVSYGRVVLGLPFEGVA